MTARAAHTPVAVLGAGSWGTALAIQFARGGRAVRLWSRDAAQLAAMAHSRRNARYLPESPFPWPRLDNRGRVPCVDVAASKLPDF